ncbi:NodQ bifunctional enzyme [Skermanella stibiiresistens SB22]|uniref:Adenylyl-sulfate kinase n=1 Tax=Skermanella stibiiresistens SB22 TaxID=1385369 RepID=W9HCY4_9PROT|nr:adenylyl-sulfate kinase [Skermanella stibiiresistens]EWY42567.1 NodQ bifunctional enzyme [Skermanella stibiiresistens SB22]
MPANSEISDVITAAQRRQARIVIVGHVDHGKSTLIGRLLNDTQSLPDGKVEAVREMSRRRGMPFEWSFVMDALQAERDQGITIDTTQIHFKTARRPYVIIDAPGHTEFLKNMVTGAANADAALLVIDAGEGALEQSRRHAYLLHLLGVKQVAVIVNKMDMVDFSRERFDQVAAEIKAYLADIGVAPGVILPISARHGDNIASRSENLAWFDGPTVIEALDGFLPAAPEDELPLRLPIQDVYKPDERRILAGRIETGRLRVGDTLHFSPINKTAKVVTIEAWNAATPITASAGQSIGITLDQRIFVERGHVASLASERPIEAHRLTVRLFWLASQPLQTGKAYTLKLATAEHRVTVERIVEVVNIDDLSVRAADTVGRNEIANVVLHSRSLVAVDPAVDLPRTGRGQLLDGHDVVGGFIVTQADAVAERNLHKVEHAVTPDERAFANGHRGAVLWLTGLSGAGKSTLAMGLERILFERGRQVYVLDGDGVRQGLNGDLGFSPTDRSENIRRVAEAARLFAEAGMIVVTALISPTRQDRAKARAIAGDLFNEVHVKADLDTCEARDPKGLYRRARAGEIKEFTGVSAPYEEPEAAELVVDTAELGIEEAVAELVRHAERVTALKHPSDAVQGRGDGI